MRLICSLSNQNEAERFYHFLVSQKIETDLEVHTSEKGVLTFRIWIINEDDVFEAKARFDEFQSNPDAPQFEQTSVPSSLFSENTPPKKKKKKKSSPSKGFFHYKATPPRPPSTGRFNFFLLMSCIFLFTLTQLDVRSYQPKGKQTPPPTTPIVKTLLYDYTSKQDLQDRWLKLADNPQSRANREIQLLLRELKKKELATPEWKGLYEEIQKSYVEEGKESTPQAPLFEKIREGELWRLFTPCLLHANLFHLFFNLLWMIVLGNQIEQRMGTLRYALLAILTGVLSNTAQYLMGGPQFIGISGVVCGLIAFIWMRQRIAPWEGYQLQRASIVFITIFVLAIAAIQGYSFYMELLYGKGFSTQIANTAHISGGIIGLLLARIPYFSAKN